MSLSKGYYGDPNLERTCPQKNQAVILTLFLSPKRYGTPVEPFCEDVEPFVRIPFCEDIFLQAAGRRGSSPAAGLKSPAAFPRVPYRPPPDFTRARWWGMSARCSPPACSFFLVAGGETPSSPGGSLIKASHVAEVYQNCPEKSFLRKEHLDWLMGKVSVPPPYFPPFPHDPSNFFSFAGQRFPGHNVRAFRWKQTRCVPTPRTPGADFGRWFFFGAKLYNEHTQLHLTSVKCDGDTPPRPQHILPEVWPRPSFPASY